MDFNSDVAALKKAASFGLAAVDASGPTGP
jgi:hypothetical protein